MITPRWIGTLVLVSIATLTGPLPSFGDEAAPAAPQAPFFKAEDVFAGQRPALNDPFGLIWSNNPWQPFASPFGAFNFSVAQNSLVTVFTDGHCFHV